MTCIHDKLHWGLRITVVPIWRQDTFHLRMTTKTINIHEDIGAREHHNSSKGVNLLKKRTILYYNYCQTKLSLEVFHFSLFHFWGPGVGREIGIQMSSARFLEPHLFQEIHIELHQHQYEQGNYKNSENNQPACTVMELIVISCKAFRKKAFYTDQGMSCDLQILMNPEGEKSSGISL